MPEAPKVPLNTLQQLRNYFEMSSTQFAIEWKELSTEDKEWFKEQIQALKK